jgi:hypothetical protein
MTSTLICGVLYIIDIQYYTTINEDWGVGNQKCKNRDKFIYLSIVRYA